MSVQAVAFKRGDFFQCSGRKAERGIALSDGAAWARHSRQQEQTCAGTFGVLHDGQGGQGQVADQNPHLWQFTHTSSRGHHLLYQASLVA
ncbi:hypothetical protein KC352_g10 [Hortaea werneckii]|nr:hypothetical protein KC352_g10 [Hortaea werneckii]